MIQSWGGCEMRRRAIELAGVVAILAAVTMLLQLAPVPAGGQEPDGAPLTAWGEPDLQGIWTNNFETPLERPARYADREFFTDEERAELDAERARLLGTRRSERGSEQDVGGAYDASIFLTHKHLGRRTSLIVDPPDGRLPPTTPEVRQRREETSEFQFALLQSTDACKTSRPGCPPPGPPSPRREETPPHYMARSVNRAYGPEDRSLSERCLGARLPDFGSVTGFFLQVVQSPGAVSLFYDTGQGQGWQRVVPVTDRPHLPPSVRQWRGDSRARWDGNTLVVDVANFSPKTDFYGSRENLHLVRWTRLDAETSSRWTIRRPGRARGRSPSSAEQRSEPDLQGTALSRGELRPAGPLPGARAGEQAWRGRLTRADLATLCIAGGAAACGGFGGGFAEAGEEATQRWQPAQASPWFS